MIRAILSYRQNVRLKTLKVAWYDQTILRSYPIAHVLRRRNIRRLRGNPGRTSATADRWWRLHEFYPERSLLLPAQWRLALGQPSLSLRRVRKIDCRWEGWRLGELSR